MVLIGFYGKVETNRPGRNGIRHDLPKPGQERQQRVEHGRGRAVWGQGALAKEQERSLHTRSGPQGGDSTGAVQRAGETQLPGVRVDRRLDTLPIGRNGRQPVGAPAVLVEPATDPLGEPGEVLPGWTMDEEHFVPTATRTLRDIEPLVDAVQVYPGVGQGLAGLTHAEAHDAPERANLVDPPRALDLQAVEKSGRKAAVAMARRRR